MGTVLAILFCVFFFPFAICIGLLRWGTAFPRFGRWLDARLYRAFPRLGHVFIDSPDEHPDE
jgi:hypothetical protein